MNNQCIRLLLILVAMRSVALSPDFIPTIADYPPIFLDEPLFILDPAQCDITNDRYYSKVVFQGYINLAKMTHEDYQGGLITLNFRTHVFFDFTGLCVLWLDTSKTNVCDRKKLNTVLDDPTSCYCGAIRDKIVPIHVTTQYQYFFRRASEIILHWTSFTNTGTVSSAPRIAKIPKYGFYVNNCAREPRVIVPFVESHYAAYSTSRGSSFWILPALLISLANTFFWMT